MGSVFRKPLFFRFSMVVEGRGRSVKARWLWEGTIRG